MDSSRLNSINTPLPGSFDEVILDGGKLAEYKNINSDPHTFVAIYGDGTEESAGVPLYVFNYLDYKIWNKYNCELRGNDYKVGHEIRQKFFDTLGCDDFDLDNFVKFYLHIY